MKQVAVIGLGRFGMSVVQTLSERGVQVLAIDKNEKLVEQASEYAARAVQLEATDEAALRDVGIQDMDAAVVGIGRNISSSILITLLLKQLGVKRIICKALDQLQGKVIEKLGADRVVYPEKEMGARVAESLTAPGIFEHIKLSSSHAFMEIDVPKSFEGKTVGELALRARYGIQLVAVKREVTQIDKKGKVGVGENIIIAPTADDGLIGGDRLVVLGKNEDIEKLKKVK